MSTSDAVTERGTPSLTRLQARRLQEIAVCDLPEGVREKAALCLLDYLGAVIGGLSAPWAPAILRYATSRGGEAQAHLWGAADAVSAEDAAFANGALGHSLIRDDMHLMSASHIGVLVNPAILALAQREQLSGEAVIRGVIGGYDAAAALGTAVLLGGGNTHFRPSGINGPFGAASAAAVAVQLDEDTTVSALGFAANAAAGLNEWPWAGGEEINTHAGMAARNGLAAFDVAAAGMRSSESVLEGRDGLFAAYGAGHGPELFAQCVGGAFGIMEVTFKPFPGCNLIQTPIAAAIEVSRQLGTRAAEIKHVVITTCRQAQAYPGCDNLGPFDEVQQAKMSLQYGVASALVFGRVDEATYGARQDPELLRVIAQTRIEVDDDLGRALLEARQPARIDVHLNDGTVLVATLDDVPWLDGEGVEGRFRAVAAAVLPADAVDRIVTLVGGLWDLDDLTELFGVFLSAEASSPV